MGIGSSHAPAGQRLASRARRIEAPLPVASFDSRMGIYWDDPRLEPTTHIRRPDSGVIIVEAWNGEGGRE